MEGELRRYTTELLLLTFERKKSQRGGLDVLSTMSEFLHASGDSGTNLAVACCFWIHSLTADEDFAARFLAGLRNS